MWTYFLNWLKTGDVTSMTTPYDALEIKYFLAQDVLVHGNYSKNFTQGCPEDINIFSRLLQVLCCYYTRLCACILL